MYGVVIAAVFGIGPLIIDLQLRSPYSRGIDRRRRGSASDIFHAPESGQELLELRLSFADAWAVEICIDDELVIDDFEVVFEFAGWHIEVGCFEQLAFLELWRFDADEECAIAQFIEESELRFGIGSSA